METLIFAGLTLSGVIVATNKIVNVIKPFITDKRLIPVLALIISVTITILFGLATKTDNFELAQGVISILGALGAQAMYEDNKKGTDDI